MYCDDEEREAEAEVDGGAPISILQGTKHAADAQLIYMYTADSRTRLVVNARSKSRS